MENIKVPVLNYHGIEASPGEYHWTDEERVYVIGSREFEAQLDRITAEGFQTVLPSELLQWKAGELELDKPLLITFDDGHISHYEHAAVMLRKRNMKAVFFVSAEWVGRSEFMNAAQLADLSAGGFEIGSHGCGHIPLPALPSEKLDHEIYSSKIMLEKWIGKQVDSFSIPRGFYHSKIKKRVQDAGYSFMFTSHFGANERSFDPFYLKRMAPTAYTGLTEFENWIHCRLGSRALTESVKEYARQLLGPGFYGGLASIKARLLAGGKGQSGC